MSIRLCIYPDFLMEQAQREAEEHERLLVKEGEAWCQQDVFMEGFLAPMKNWWQVHSTHLNLLSTSPINV